MKKIILILFSIYSVPESAQNAERIYKKVSDAIVKIETYKNKTKIGGGSGIIIKSKNWVVTNYHVTEGCDFIVAMHKGKFIDLSSTLAFDAAKDILIMKIASDKIEKEVWDKIPSLKMGAKKDLRIGQKIYAIGSPFGLENTITEGIISGKRFRNDSSQDLIQISAPISSGSSGGAIIDNKGRLIAISTMIIIGKSLQNLNFAVPVDDVFEVAKGKEKPNENHPKELLDYYLHKADLSLTGYKFQEAINNIHLALSLNQKIDYPHLLYTNMGKAFHSLKQSDSALYYLNKSVTHKPSQEAYTEMGMIEQENHYWQIALTNFDKALRFAPDNSEALIGKATCHLELKQLLQATLTIEKELKYRPHNAIANYLLGKLLVDVKKYNESIIVFQEAIRYNPIYKEAYLAISDAYKAMGDTTNEKVYFDKMKTIKN